MHRVVSLLLGGERFNRFSLAGQVGTQPIHWSSLSPYIYKVYFTRSWARAMSCLAVTTWELRAIKASLSGGRRGGSSGAFATQLRAGIPPAALRLPARSRHHHRCRSAEAETEGAGDDDDAGVQTRRHYLTRYTQFNAQHPHQLPCIVYSQPYTLNLIPESYTLHSEPIP
jgi:hypothetical protein